MNVTEQKLVIRQVALAILDGVKAGDVKFGAPGGHIYAALMTVGINLDQYQRLMDCLVEMQVIVKKGQYYFVGPKANIFDQG